MVGDDVRTDIRAAQRAGLRGIFVLSGKHGPADVELRPRSVADAVQTRSRRHWPTSSPR